MVPRWCVSAIYCSFLRHHDNGENHSKRVQVREEPSKLFGMTHTLFPPHPLPQSKPKKTPKSVPVPKPIPQQNPQTSRFEPSPSPSPTSLPESTQTPPIQTTGSLEK